MASLRNSVGKAFQRTVQVYAVSEFPPNNDNRVPLGIHLANLGTKIPQWTLMGTTIGITLICLAQKGQTSGSYGFSKFLQPIMVLCGYVVG